MSFAAAIARGLAAAQAAWGVSFTIANGPALTGTFDRLSRTDSPDDGGIRLTWDATMVASRPQFAGILDEMGDPILDEAGDAILGEADELPRIGDKLTTGGTVYRIGALDVDAHQVTMRLINVNQ